MQGLESSSPSVSPVEAENIEKEKDVPDQQDEDINSEPKPKKPRTLEPHSFNLLFAKTMSDIAARDSQSFQAEVVSDPQLNPFDGDLFAKSIQD